MLNTFFKTINYFKKNFDQYNKEKFKLKPQDGLTLDKSVINELEKFQKKMEEKYTNSDKPIEIADIHKGYVLTAHIIKEFIDDMFLVEEKLLNGSSSFKNNVLKRKNKFYKLTEDMLKTQKNIFKSNQMYEEKILYYFSFEKKKQELLNLIVDHSLNLMACNSKNLLENLYEEENHPTKKETIGFINKESGNEQ